MSGFGYALTLAGGSAGFGGYLDVAAGDTATVTVHCRELSGSVLVWVGGQVQVTRVATPHFG
jgi:hypothetical protein